MSNAEIAGRLPPRGPSPSRVIVQFRNAERAARSDTPLGFSARAS
jgi:hypothetical protein